MRITFALGFDERAAAGEAAEQLEAWGFEVEALEPLTASLDVRDAEQLADLRDALTELAVGLGGEFLGNGSFARVD
jgi:hypothetical protein